MQKYSQRKITQEFSLILDVSGLRKSGNLTIGVGRHYSGCQSKLLLLRVVLFYLMFKINKRNSLTLY